MLIKTEVARSVPFDNATNGFTANNVQEAIEEAASGITGMQQSKAHVISGAVVYVSYNPLINISGNYLSLETLP